MKISYLFFAGMILFALGCNVSSEQNDHGHSHESGTQDHDHGAGTEPHSHGESEQEEFILSNDSLQAKPDSTQHIHEEGGEPHQH